MSIVLHTINRLTYGLTPGELKRVERIGVRGYVAEQLEPAKLAEPAELKNLLRGYKALTWDPPALFLHFGKHKELPSDVTLDPGATEKPGEIRAQPAKAKLLRAILSPAQLHEVMVDFWYNHFNVSNAKGPTGFWVGCYERDAIRPHALGKFRNLLVATAHHPAMLHYLDNARNTAPESPAGRKSKQGLNENYARELLELHTLGVDGGYTQGDVRELARILTGWGVRPAGPGTGPSTFFFAPGRHDDREKTLLGMKYPPAGESEVMRALTQLAEHPATARHVGFKLAQRFVADQPPASLVEKLGKRYLETDGDIRQILMRLFESPEFLDARYQGKKFKTPFHYLASYHRLLGLPPDNLDAAVGTLRQWGMPLYGCATPNGYSCEESDWLSPAALMQRIQFAVRTGQFQPSRPRPSADREATPEQQALDRIRRQASLSGPPGESVLADVRPFLSRRSLASLDGAPASFRLNLFLASPEFLRY
ncbi:MAG: DUF1800 domain-containing protein [Methylococcus sp.]